MESNATRQGKDFGCGFRMAAILAPGLTSGTPAETPHVADAVRGTSAPSTGSASTTADW